MPPRAAEDAISVGRVCGVDASPKVANAQIAFVCGAISDPSGAVLLGVDR